VTSNNQPLQNLSCIINEHSRMAFGRKSNNNLFRHAMHTHGEKIIGTKSIAKALGHSERVAQKHYVHQTSSSTAFKQFYDLVKESCADEPEGTSSTQVESTEATDDCVTADNFVVVVYDEWFVGRVISKCPLKVEFLEKISLNRYVFDNWCNNFLRNSLIN